MKQQYFFHSFTWIGLNDRAEEGKYVWTDKSNNSFSSWKETQVYDEVQRHYEDCVAMDAEGNWFTFSCQNRFLFLCKKTLGMMHLCYYQVSFSKSCFLMIEKQRRMIKITV